ncbi:carboxymuconolactone decarboxylase family protein [Marinimicrobium sp. ABcell2]|uniref:carboxymuconolactone decarboxylase family protein n=1 Tax=Marinimicrobium sp. ABcell2 TaxID=3069751 RepID=UPI0027B4EBA0|nr:carboxymuconolactone decarboxylase family protein [Marinimicrobium sp. ABcell2]MDQ2078424.1 carboxymuconolactone decarboxylase family protein [Marinimicrobium sp. ABcell2]
MMKTILNTSIAALVMILTLGLSPAYAQAPEFIQETYPERGVNSAWESYQAVFLDPNAALDAKSKELMALAVSAQVPCDYCVYYHTQAARSHGATDEEIKEAVAVAGLVRKWSTILNGVQYDKDEWRQNVDEQFSDN